MGQGTVSRRAALALPPLALAGCASIIRGTSQDIAVTSSPPNASVAVYDENNREVYSGTTPATVSLRKRAGYFSGKDYRVRVEKPGYAPFELPLTRSVSAWYIAGNIFIGGLIGWLIVDPLTGGMWVYDPPRLSPDLAPLQADAGEGGALALNVVLLEQAPANVRARMRPLKAG